ncbi:hypothetical protein C8F04DRAFT_1324631 [Mycena alexandri]|uniref:Uncharacterized protein n=1 Tax=Mycena alexandri TaxID=1745969 RepID=A0AAD6S1Y9_9AGAR|nr:hypothetical protein C8F04DRAFT_1324631 [Mycena alexandri]
MITSFPSTIGADNPASPAPLIQAPTGFSTVPPSTPTTPLDFTSTAFATHLGLGVPTAPGPHSGSLFTTTIVYTSGGSVYTTVSTGVLGTGRPVPHDFAHNVGAIIGVALGSLIALILIVPRPVLRFLLYGAARGLRRPPGAWRSPIDGDSVYSLVSDSGEDHGDTSLLEAESGMREARASQSYWGSAPFSDSDAADISSAYVAQTPDLISMHHDAIWLPTPPSSLSIPALLAADGARPADPRTLSPQPATPRSSLLNPPLAPSSSTVALPPPATPQPEWPGLRSSIAHSQSLALGAEPRPSAADPTTGTPIADPRPSPAPSVEPSAAHGQGLLRPSLTVLQSHSSRTLDDHVDYSRLIGAQRAGTGDTFDTASSRVDSVADLIMMLDTGDRGPLNPSTV